MDAVKPKILFVDDEESILEIAQEYFQQKGYQIYTAPNGRLAAEVLKRERLDCCFTDINMPEMDGLALSEYIHRHDRTLPVIIMTGHPSLHNTIRTLKNGVVDFLIKPVNLSQMELCVQRVLRERRLFVENLLLKKDIEQKARLEQLNKELLQKVEELHTLNKIMSDFTQNTTSVEVYARLTKLAAEISHADQAGFFVMNDQNNRPLNVAHYPSISKDATMDCSKRISAIQALVMECASDELPLLVQANGSAGRLPRSIESFMAVPVKIRTKVFGVLTATFASGRDAFNEKDLYYLSFMAQKAAYVIENLALYENIYDNLFATLYAFVRALGAKDQYTQEHSRRVTHLALAIGHELGCSSEEIDTIKFAGHLHDIGKMGIRDDILLKPGRLTPDEYETIKTHPVIGASIVGQLGLWEKEQLIIRHHHERFDGTGYPDGLKGEQIPFLARLLAVADVYDAMASDRPYRQRMLESEIVAVISKGAGTQFDPRIVSAFMQLYEDGQINKLYCFDLDRAMA